MSETSKRKKYLMWYKVNELLSSGLKMSQISSELGIHRQTVSKYVSMSESEFLESQSYDRSYGHKLDGYESYVTDELRRWPFLSAPQIHDRLKENFSNLPSVTSKTVFNFVSHVRAKHGLPKEKEKRYRPYEKQLETPYGKYAQCDFGERWMTTAEGNRKKVYFFVLCLCRSRYKFVYISDTPFTSALSIYAHELAFEYFGGIPEQIVYDQDKVFISDENLGDYKLTKAFRTFVNEQGFKPMFCRKSDPESKGMVENVVKYVKYNFLRGREYVSAENLNEGVRGWLQRTANGTMHHGIQRVPSEEYEQEKEYLKPYTGIPTLPVEQMTKYHVRKDNVITYHGNFYSVPTGTYNGHGTLVYVMVKDRDLNIYSVETGKTIATHKVSEDKGRVVSCTSHRRDREASLDEYEASVRSQLPGDEVVGLYLSALRKNKSRHYRDNLQAIVRRSGEYTHDTFVEAVSKCLESSVFNGNHLIAAAESIRKLKGETPIAVDTHAYEPSAPHTECASMIPEQTNMSTYKHLFR